MLDINHLDRIIYGKTPATEDGSEHLIAIAMSENLTPEDADIWRGLVTLELPAATIEQKSQTVGLFNGPDRHFILAQAHIQEEEETSPIFQCVLLPRPFFLGRTGNIKAVIDMAQAAFPTDPASNTPLAPLPIKSGKEDTTLDRADFFQSLINQQDTIDMPTLFALLDAALSDACLLVLNFPTEFADRIALIQALMFLLPTPARFLFC